MWRKKASEAAKNHDRDCCRYPHAGHNSTPGDAVRSTRTLTRDKLICIRDKIQGRIRHIQLPKAPCFELVLYVMIFVLKRFVYCLILAGPTKLWGPHGHRSSYRGYGYLRGFPQASSVPSAIDLFQRRKYNTTLYGIFRGGAQVCSEGTSPSSGFEIDCYPHCRTKCGRRGTSSARRGHRTSRLAEGNRTIRSIRKRHIACTLEMHVTCIKALCGFF